jgi:hypothetical protein
LRCLVRDIHTMELSHRGFRLNDSGMEIASFEDDRGAATDRPINAT